MQLEIGEDGRGRRVASKRAESAEEAARLRREADLLDVATHPALVEVLAFDDGPTPVMQTVFVGPSLVGGRPLEVDEIAGVVAAVGSRASDRPSTPTKALPSSTPLSTCSGWGWCWPPCS